MTAVSVQLSDSTHRRAQALAAAEGMSLGQFVTATLDEMVAQSDTLARMQQRSERGAGVDIESILAKVPDIAPAPEDRLQP